MNVVKLHRFGEVTGIELGFGPAGPPLMNVFFFVAGGAVIDTGQRHMRREALGAIRRKHPECLLLTHHHEDHSGNARAMAKEMNIPVFGHPLAAERMARGFYHHPYRHAIWGKAPKTVVRPLPEVIDTGRYRFRPIPTPGHSRDHVAYLEENNGWLFSGDLYLGDRIKFFRPNESVDDQIDSLKRVLEHDFDALLCAHHPRACGGRRHIEAKLSFLTGFREEVEDLDRKGCPEKVIIRTLDSGGDRAIRWITLGDASFANMVRSALRAIRGDAPSPHRTHDQ